MITANASSKWLMCEYRKLTPDQQERLRERAPIEVASSRLLGRKASPEGLEFLRRVSASK